MKMKQRTFRIGELARILSVERFVIRFWEKEFNVSTTRSSGKQRFYTQKDVDRFTYIKTLLYDRGFTIAGAKKELEQPTISETPSKSSYKASKRLDPQFNKKTEELTKQLRTLEKKLKKLRELL